MVDSTVPKEAKIVFIRHGQQLYNVLKRELVAKGEDLISVRFKEELIDCNVTEEGQKQAEAVRELLKDKDVGLVISSPFRRALDTARIVFGNHKDKPNKIVLQYVREVLSSATDIPYKFSEVKKQYSEFDFSALDIYEIPQLWTLETLFDEKQRTTLLNGVKEELKKAKNDNDFDEYNVIKKFLIKEAKSFHPGQLESPANVFNRAKAAEKELARVVKKHYTDTGVIKPVYIISHSQFMTGFEARELGEDGKPKDGKYFNNCEMFEYNLKLE